MKVLVTGGTGFTGSHTVRALLAAGHEVRLLVRDAAKLRRVFEADAVAISDFVVGDMVDAASVEKALAGCDGLVHAAALVDLRAARAREVMETNARGVELVVGGAARHGLSSIVYVSSLSIFFVPGGPPITPELPIAPATTAYAKSKCEAEHYVREAPGRGRSDPHLVPGRHHRPRRPGHERRQPHHLHLVRATSAWSPRAASSRWTCATWPRST